MHKKINIAYLYPKMTNSAIFKLHLQLQYICSNKASSLVFFFFFTLAIGFFPPGTDKTENDFICVVFFYLMHHKFN